MDLSGSIQVIASIDANGKLRSLQMEWGMDGLRYGCRRSDPTELTEVFTAEVLRIKEEATCQK